ncbi:hypothetical protein Nepgr_007801 [Nepenthes gracilis]|uniref:Uncharacterized protein n=1 Tax=Nepenthes gracilis TaxID=150966 RepID=A0AAD3S8H3_NEPGR|nr:hypothetical protein Nepgr_007801 [Nepenthes gracilis]
MPCSSLVSSVSLPISKLDSEMIDVQSDETVLASSDICCEGVGGRLAARRSHSQASHGKVLVGCTIVTVLLSVATADIAAPWVLVVLIFPSDALLNGCWRCGTSAPGCKVVSGQLLFAEICTGGVLLWLKILLVLPSVNLMHFIVVVAG